MSMIDHDEQDRLRAQSRTNADSLRYRHIGSGAIYRVHSQARSPDGPICLVAADAPRGAMWTMQVSAAELARTFVRCDGTHASVAAPPSAPDFARVAFEAYGASTGGKTWDGKPIPAFDVIRERTPHVAAAWEAAASAVLAAAGAAQ
mgnify:CR=1 FL=1